MKNRSFVVGVFVIVGLTLFAAGLFLIGNRHEAFARHIEYYAVFKDLSGLTKGTKVQVGGMDAGEVLDIGVPSSPAGGFRVHFRINEALRGLVRTDSVATVGTEGVVGDTLLLIRPGSANAPAASAQSLLPSKEPVELADLLDQGKGVLGEVDTTLKTANGVLVSVGGNLNTTLGTVETTVGNVNDVVVGIKQGRGPAGMVLRDETVANHLRQTVLNAQQATTDLSHASGQANAMITDIQSRQIPQKVDDALVSVKDAAANVDVSTGQLRQTISEATSPDAQGVTLGVNLRDSVANTNVATANMADETEALKHNFFFRSFFHHRGYFNLANMPADKYRKDRLFASASNARAWLPAEQMFVRNAQDVEELSTKGKALLDNVIASHGDTIVGTPIVVEGYANRPDAGEQLAQSRDRAILVRNYLVNHFQLDPSHFGVVALNNRPPSGLDHPAWDGICIVLVTQKHG